MFSFSFSLSSLFSFLFYLFSFSVFFLFCLLFCLSSFSLLFSTSLSISLSWLFDREIGRGNQERRKVKGEGREKEKKKRERKEKEKEKEKKKRKKRESLLSSSSSLPSLFPIWGVARAGGPTGAKTISENFFQLSTQRLKSLSVYSNRQFCFYFGTGEPDLRKLPHMRNRLQPSFSEIESRAEKRT